MGDTVESIGWDNGTSFSDTSFSFLLKSAVAYAFHYENPMIDLDTNNIIISDETTRINGCIGVPQKSRQEIQDALTEAQERVYEILGYDQDQLSFDEVAKKYEYKEPPSFEPWLIPYIITWCIIILAGAVMFWPSKSEEIEEEKDEIENPAFTN